MIEVREQCTTSGRRFFDLLLFLERGKPAQARSHVAEVPEKARDEVRAEEEDEEDPHLRCIQLNHLIDSNYLTPFWQTSEGSFSAISKPHFAIKY